MHLVQKVNGGCALSVRVAIAKKDFNRGNANMSASTQKMIREGQHVSETKNVGGKLDIGGGAMGPTSDGKLPRQQEQNENPIRHEPTLHDRPGNLHPLHQRYYTWCCTVHEPHERICSEQ